mgnify:CR=1 FL=1
MRRDLAAVCDMADSARLARAHAAGRSFQDFMNDQALQDAVVFRVLIVGEAAKRVSAVMRARYPQVPWGLAAAMRNRIIHEYDRIHFQTVWDTVKSDLPVLLEQLERILAENPPE